VPLNFLNEFEKQGGRLKTGKDMHESRQREKAKEQK